MHQDHHKFCPDCRQVSRHSGSMDQGEGSSNRKVLVDGPTIVIEEVKPPDRKPEKKLREYATDKHHQHIKPQAGDQVVYRVTEQQQQGHGSPHVAVLGSPQVPLGVSSALGYLHLGQLARVKVPQHLMQQTASADDGAVQPIPALPSPPSPQHKLGQQQHSQHMADTPPSSSPPSSLKGSPRNRSHTHHYHHQQQQQHATVVPPAEGGSSDGRRVSPSRLHVSFADWSVAQGAAAAGHRDNISPGRRSPRAAAAAAAPAAAAAIPLPQKTTDSSGLTIVRPPSFQPSPPRHSQTQQSPKQPAHPHSPQPLPKLTLAHHHQHHHHHHHQLQDASDKGHLSPPRPHSPMRVELRQPPSPQLRLQRSGSPGLPPSPRAPAADAAQDPAVLYATAITVPVLQSGPPSATKGPSGVSSQQQQQQQQQQPVSLRSIQQQLQKQHSQLQQLEEALAARQHSDTSSWLSRSGSTDVDQQQPSPPAAASTNVVGSGSSSNSSSSSSSARAAGLITPHASPAAFASSASSSQAALQQTSTATTNRPSSPSNASGSSRTPGSRSVVAVTPAKLQLAVPAGASAHPPLPLTWSSNSSNISSTAAAAASAAASEPSMVAAGPQLEGHDDDTNAGFHTPTGAGTSIFHTPLSTPGNFSSSSIRSLASSELSGLASGGRAQSTAAANMPETGRGGSSSCTGGAAAAAWQQHSEGTAAVASVVPGSAAGRIQVVHPTALSPSVVLQAAADKLRHHGANDTPSPPPPTAAAAHPGISSSEGSTSAASSAAKFPDPISFNKWMKPPTASSVSSTMGSNTAAGSRPTQLSPIPAGQPALQQQQQPGLLQPGVVISTPRTVSSGSGDSSFSEAAEEALRAAAAGVSPVVVTAEPKAEAADTAGTRAKSRDQGRAAGMGAGPSTAAAAAARDGSSATGGGGTTEFEVELLAIIPGRGKLAGRPVLSSAAAEQPLNIRQLAQQDDPALRPGKAKRGLSGWIRRHASLNLGMSVRAGKQGLGWLGIRGCFRSQGDKKE